MKKPFVHASNALANPFGHRDPSGLCKAWSNESWSSQPLPGVHTKVHWLLWAIQDVEVSATHRCQGVVEKCKAKDWGGFCLPAWHTYHLCLASAFLAPKHPMLPCGCTQKQKSTSNALGLEARTLPKSIWHCRYSQVYIRVSLNMQRSDHKYTHKYKSNLVSYSDKSQVHACPTSRHILAKSACTHRRKSSFMSSNWQFTGTCKSQVHTCQAKGPPVKINLTSTSRYTKATSKAKKKEKSFKKHLEK